MENGITRKELNGMGERLTDMSIILAKTEERSETNETNIEKLFTNFETKSKQFSDKADKVFNGTIIGAIILVAGLFVKEMVFK